MPIASLISTAAVAVVHKIGFGVAGVQAGSLAAWMMSTAAVANGGGVTAGGVVASLQSAGAVGAISSTSSAVIGTGSAVVAVVSGWMHRFFRRS